VNGAFGSILTAFPEAKITVTYFNMQPLPGSGYGPRTDIETLSGVLQCVGGRRVGTRNGNAVIERQMRYWSDTPLQVGWFIDDGKYVYRIGIPDDDWSDEADMTIYTLERVVGADGTETVEPAFDQGTGSFA
jgi:hypothetical protein